MEEIKLDAAMQTLDPGLQQRIVSAVLDRESQATAAAPDAIRLLKTTQAHGATIYDVEIEVGGRVDHVNIAAGDDGSIAVRPAE